MQMGKDIKFMGHTENWLHVVMKSHVASSCPARRMSLHLNDQISMLVTQHIVNVMLTGFRI